MALLSQTPPQSDQGFLTGSDRRKIPNSRADFLQMMEPASDWRSSASFRARMSHARTLGAIIGLMDWADPDTSPEQRKELFDARTDWLLHGQIMALHSISDEQVFLSTCAEFLAQWATWRERVPFSSHVANFTISQMSHSNRFPSNRLAVQAQL